LNPNNNILTLLKMELAILKNLSSRLISLDTKMSLLDLKQLFKSLLLKLDLSLLLLMQDLALSNSITEVSTMILAALLPLSITVSSLLVMVSIKDLTTGWSRIHGELLGDYKDTL